MCPSWAEITREAVHPLILAQDEDLQMTITLEIRDAKLPDAEGELMPLGNGAGDWIEPEEARQVPALVIRTELHAYHDVFLVISIHVSERNAGA